MYLLSKPISVVMESLFGPLRRDKFNSEDIKKIIELFYQKENEDDAEEVSMTFRKRLLSGAMDIKSWTAGQIMKNYEDVAAVNVSEPLTESFIKSLREEGYSRFPVYRNNKHHVIGILLVKKLIGLKNFGLTLEQFNMKFRRPLVITSEMPLIELLVEFRKGKSHIALVTDQVSEVQQFLAMESGKKPKSNIKGYDELAFQAFTIKGIVTLEDVTEKALGT